VRQRDGRESRQGKKGLDPFKQGAKLICPKRLLEKNLKAQQGGILRLEGGGKERGKEGARAAAHG